MRSPPAASAREPRRDRARACLVAGAAVLLLAYVALPGFHRAFWITFALWNAAAMVWGAQRYRPPHRVAWLLLAAAAAMFSMSNATDFSSLEHPTALPTNLDWLGLVAYLPALAGLLVMIRHRLAGRNRGGVLDALVAVVSLTFVVWVYVILRYVNAPHETVAYRLAAIAQPVGDLVLLGVFARLLAPATARTPSLWLLLTGTVAMTISDVLDALWRLGSLNWFGTTAQQVVLESGWVVFGLTWAAAALTPSMRQDTRPISAPSAAVPAARVATLAVVALIAPAVVTVQLVRGEDTTGWVGPVLAGVVFLLILARFGLVLADHRRVLAREQVLLDAGGSLAEAAGAAEVTAR